MNEKVTDKARDMFEKATGKDVPSKVRSFPSFGYGYTQRRVLFY